MIANKRTPAPGSLAYNYYVPPCFREQASDIDLCHAEDVETRATIVLSHLQAKMAGERNFTLLPPQDCSKGVKTWKIMGLGRTLVDFSEMPCDLPQTPPSRWPNDSDLPVAGRVPVPTLAWLVQKSLSCLQDQVHMLGTAMRLLLNLGMHPHSYTPA